MKISLNKIRLSCCYSVLIMAFAHVSLRVQDSGETALFRLFAPVLVLIILLSSFSKYKTDIIWMVNSIVYSIVVSILFYDSIQWRMHGFLIYLYMEYIIIKYISIIDRNWRNDIYNFLDKFTVLTILLCLFQYVTGYVFPHIPFRSGETPVFFWNGNELSAAIMCMAIIYTYRGLYIEGYELIKALLIFLIAYYNDAKLSMIGFIISVYIIMIYKILTQEINRHKFSNTATMMFGIIIILVAVVYLSIQDVIINFRGDKYTFNTLIGDAFFHIITLQAFPPIGSIHVRANAIIYGLIELNNTWFWGIGFGNSLLMLQKEEYVMPNIGSMHNIIAQIITEFGIFGGYWMCRLLLHTLLNVIRGCSKSKCLLRFAFIMGFVFISSQSSGGILSNYMIWAVFIYIMLVNASSKILGD